jgi:hypothetical protein
MKNQLISDQIMLDNAVFISENMKKSSVGNHLKDNCRIALDEFSVHIKGLQNVAICPQSFEDKLRKTFDCFPNLQYLLNVDISTETTRQALRDLYLFTSELVINILIQERVNCLVLDIRVSPSKVYISITHDQWGVEQVVFDALKLTKSSFYGISSIEQQLDLLNLTIDLDIGSITLSNCHF